MPVYEAPDEVPKGYFRLLYGRSPLHSFARTQNNEILNGYQPENDLWINDKIAAELGLIDGEYVNLENQDGMLSNNIKLNVTPGIRPDAVFMVHGFDHKSPLLKRAYGKGASDTYLLSRYKVDPISGGTGMRVNFVRIIKDGQPVMISGAVSAIGRFKSTRDARRPVKKVVVPRAVQSEEDEGC